MIPVLAARTLSASTGSAVAWHSEGRAFASYLIFALPIPTLMHDLLIFYGHTKWRLFYSICKTGEKWSAIILKFKSV